jgi:hypothetical protein
MIGESRMIILRKGTSAEHLEQEKALWWPMTDEGKQNALFSCPGCGETFGLSRWTIAVDGSVWPSVDHSRPILNADGTSVPSYCQFHDMIRLEGWVAQNS